MSAGSRIFLVVLVLAFLGTGLYYLAISGGETPRSEVVPSVAEPQPEPAQQEVQAPPKSVVPPIETPIARDTLSVRVAVPASDPVGVDLPVRRAQFQKDGPDGLPNPKAEWFPVFDLEEFAVTEAQRDALETEPVTYFRERFGLIVEPFESKLYVLLYTTAGRSVSPSATRGVEVVSVRAVQQDTLSSNSALEVVLGSRAAQRVMRTADNNVSRMWAVLVNDVVVQLQRVTAGEHKTLTIASGLSPVQLELLEKGVAGTAPIQPATFSLRAPVITMGADGTDGNAQSREQPVLAASRTTTIAPESVSKQVAQTPAQPTRPSTTKAATQYVVQSGDTMSSIAEGWSGRASDWRLLAEHNPQVDPNRLSVGQVLKLPALTAAGAAPKSAAPAVTPTAAAGATYTIRSGDSLASISEATYGSEKYWKFLYEANKGVIGADPGALGVGDVIQLPPKPKN